MGAFKIHRGRPLIQVNPWPEDATLITNPTDLTAAVRSGPDGTHYLLAPGDYGDWNPGFQPRWTKPDGSAPVHVWGQPGVTLNSLGLNSGKFMRFHYLTTTGGAGSAAFAVGSSQDIAFDHCRSTGAANIGFGIQGSSDCSVTWCKADNTNVGFSFVLANNFTFTDCWTDMFGNDANDIFGCQTGTVARILVTNPTTGAGHPDSFQMSGYDVGATHTDSADITLTDINFDRGVLGGAATNGPVFADGSDRITWTNIASFGSNNNGASMSQMTDSSVTNAFLQSWDYAAAAVIRGTSVNCSMTDVQSTTAAADYTGTGVPTGSVYTNCTTIPQVTDANDRALYEAFLAANPSIPTPAHFANAGWI